MPSPPLARASSAVALVALLMSGPARAIEETALVQAPDGTILTVDIYRKDNTPRPVQLLRAGNGRAAVRDGGLGASVEDAGQYALVVNDYRGGVDSSGTDFMFSQDGP